MTDEPLSIWDDPNVKAKVAQGRPLNQIALLFCPYCGLVGYYNEGSHFTCRSCESNYYVASGEECVEDGRAVMRDPTMYTLEDVKESQYQSANKTRKNRE